MCKSEPNLPYNVIAAPFMSMPSFHKQVCNWLREMQLPFLTGKTEIFSTHISLLKDHVPVIEIILIDLDRWRKSGSLEDWQKVIGLMEETRRSGLKCVIIWEDYWIRKGEMVKSRLNAMLGNSQKIAARLTQARRIDQETAVKFLGGNHLNGSVASKTRFGLFLPKRYFRTLSENFQYDRKGEELLVAAATFSAPRVFDRADGPFRSFEMLRFASLLHTNVSGGLDKLVTAFARDKNPDDIMTYADREWSDGAGYEKLGFERISETGPFQFSLQAEDMMRKSVSDPAEYAIYNAGSIKFVKTYKVQS